MKTIYDNEFLTIKTDNEKEVTSYEWKATTEDIRTEEFISLCQRILEVVLESKSKLILENCLNLHFPIPPEMQEKIVEEMISRANKQLVKVAHVYAEDFISRLSQKQVWRGYNNKKNYVEEYFSSVEETEKWLYN